MVEEVVANGSSHTSSAFSSSSSLSVEETSLRPVTALVTSAGRSSRAEFPSVFVSDDCGRDREEGADREGEPNVVPLSGDRADGRRRGGKVPEETADGKGLPFTDLCFLPLFVR